MYPDLRVAAARLRRKRSDHTQPTVLNFEPVKIKELKVAGNGEE